MSLCVLEKIIKLFREERKKIARRGKVSVEEEIVLKDRRVFLSKKKRKTKEKEKMFCSIFIAANTRPR